MIVEFGVDMHSSNGIFKKCVTVGADSLEEAIQKLFKYHGKQRIKRVAFMKEYEPDIV
jgi:hypothetical protein